jgi:hypothetical protein
VTLFSRSVSQQQPEQETANHKPHLMYYASRQRRATLMYVARLPRWQWDGCSRCHQSKSVTHITVMPYTQMCKQQIHNNSRS